MEYDLYFSSNVVSGEVIYRVGLYRPTVRALFGQPELEKDEGYIAIFQRPGGQVLLIGDTALHDLSARGTQIKSMGEGWKLVHSNVVPVLKKSRTYVNGVPQDIPRGKNATVASSTTVAKSYCFFHASVFPRVVFTNKTRGETHQVINGVFGNAVVFDLPADLDLVKDHGHANRKAIPSHLDPRPSPTPAQETIHRHLDFDAHPAEPKEEQVVRLEGASLLLVGPDGDEFRESLSDAQYRMVKAVLRIVP